MDYKSSYYSRTASGITTSNYYTYKMKVMKVVNVSSYSTESYPYVVFTVDTDGNVWSFDVAGSVDYVINWTDNSSWVESDLNRTDTELSTLWSSYLP